MIPDASTLGAYKQILDVGVIGAVFILHLAFSGLIIRYFRSEVAKIEARLAKEEEAHDATRLVLLEEIKSGRDLVNNFRNQMSSQASAIDAVLKLVGKGPA